MNSIGIDLGKVNSQVSVRNAKGEVIANIRLRTKSELAKWLAEQPKSRILVEACTIARWAVKISRDAGHEVTLADPNLLAMYVDQASKRKKTDKRDADNLSLALFKGNYREAHLRSEPQQIRKCLVDTRARLVRSRAKAIAAVRAELLQYGGFMQRTEAEQFADKAVEFLYVLPEELQLVAKIELEAIKQLSGQIVAAEERLIAQVKGDATIKLLTTMPGVGLITAASFVSIIDEPTRFDDGHQLASFLGLTPTEMSSGEKRVRGHISKMGPAYLRSLLVQAAWAIWRTKKAKAHGLKQWTTGISLRRGKRLAIVALARKIGGVLLKMWKNNQSFDPFWTSSKKLAAAA